MKSIRKYISLFLTVTLMLVASIPAYANSQPAMQETDGLDVVRELVKDGQAKILTNTFYGNQEFLKVSTMMPTIQLKK